eukprot:Partr_v1_DN28266_c0_g1_i2_m75668 putative cytoplasmic FMR1 interacting protein
MYRIQYSILKPEIQKIQDLILYCDNCTELFVGSIKTMLPEYRDGFASPEFLTILARTLDFIIVIDTLKNAKASLNNDFSIYKRVCSHLRNLDAQMEDETTSNLQMYTFLATQNVFASKIKEKLNLCMGYEDILVDLVNHCATLFENQLYVKPEEKHMLLKAITFGLFFLDSPAEDKDITKRKTLKMERFGKILKSNPVVPFFGDMTMSLTNIFMKTPKLSHMKWEYDPNDDVTARSYLLSTHIDALRVEYREYLLSFIGIMNMTKRNAAAGTNLNNEQIETLYNVLLAGIRLLSSMTCRVMEQSAWKFNNPTNAQKNRHCPPSATLYEQAVRYNYGTQERFDLTEVIGFIKGLAHHLSSVPAQTAEYIQKHIYLSIQTFVRNTLKEMVSTMAKKKKPILNIVQHLSSIMAERLGGNEDNSKKKDGQAPNITAKAVGVSLTQLHYIRVLLDYSTSDKAKGMQGGFLKEKDFKENQVAEVAEFLNKATFFQPMLEFFETVRDCSDLSELWYREFYLELSKDIQFPIEMSLPWILAETALESEYQPIMEYALSPFDIYNDAAHRALHHLKSRYLYDEIEAEVNLCFDQFIYKLSQTVFTNYRIMAAAHLLDQQYKADLEYRLNAKDNRHEVVNTVYGTILKQRRFYLLGRHLDISTLIAHFCNQHMRQSIEFAIARFESGELTTICELEGLLLCSRKTHALLSQYMQLDAFDEMLAESDESLAIVTHNGRIASHVFREILTDFLPNFCYNSVTQRFVRSAFAVPSQQNSRAPAPKMMPMHLYGSKALNTTYNNYWGMFKSFIGSPHFLAMSRMLGVHNWEVLLAELSKTLDIIIRLNITPYVKVMVKGLPRSTKFPPFEYGAKGSFDYFQVIMKPILAYRDLRSGVFQVFRELGNGIVFFYLLEGYLKANRDITDIQTFALMNKASVFSDAGVDSRFRISTILKDASKILEVDGCPADFQTVGDNLEKLYGDEKPIRLVQIFLDNVKKAIEKVRPEWEPIRPGPNDFHGDQSREFSKLWSAVLFAFSIPPLTATDFTNRSLYGDGFMWAGASIVHLFEETRGFKAFDFITFLNRMASFDPKGAAGAKGNAGAVDIAQFYNNVAHNVQSTDEIFKCLEYIDIRDSRK